MSGRVFSIGHGGRSLDAVVTQLNKLEVPFLIDVRSSPFSRFQPEFSRDPLRAQLQSQHIKYVFMGDLLGGRPSDRDCYDKDGRVDYQKCRTKDFFIRGIERLRTAYAKGMRVCLLCSEGKPWECHRSKLIGWVLQDQGIVVEHVLPTGDLRTQSEVIEQLTAGQGDLFGARFSSRKVYS
ncbi:MAG: DUF488 domain-containing protein [Deltaproteobacteria bacterium]|nr:DUF488 domain-containing protein [Deltaproteobacteria bacterium]